MTLSTIPLSGIINNCYLWKIFRECWESNLGKMRPNANHSALQPPRTGLFVLRKILVKWRNLISHTGSGNRFTFSVGLFLVNLIDLVLFGETQPRWRNLISHKPNTGSGNRCWIVFSQFFNLRVVDCSNFNRYSIGWSLFHRFAYRSMVDRWSARGRSTWSSFLSDF